MKVLIYGSGAVGIGIAATLVQSEVQSENKVDVIARGKTKSAIDHNGVKRTGLFNEITIPSKVINTYENLDGLKDKKYDFILICTKSHNNVIIAEELSRHSDILDENGKIVIMQNGWGNHDQYTKYFDKEVIFSSRIITGFSRPENNVSKITVHAAPLLIGSLFGYSAKYVHPLVSAINNGGIPCEATNEIEKAIWSKMLYNCALNPLGAILSTSYGKLTENEHSTFLMNNIIDEIFAVINAANFKTYWDNAEDYKKAFYEELIPSTYEHRSSTLQDIEKKSITEIDNLTGSIVDLGQKYNIPVPYNNTIYKIIKAMESSFK